MRLLLFLFLLLKLTGSFALAQPLAQTPSSLTESWYQGVAALEQAISDLQKTNTLLSYENARLEAAIRNSQDELDSLSAKTILLETQRKQQKVLIVARQAEAISFLEQAGSLDKENEILNQEKIRIGSARDSKKEVSRNWQKDSAQLKDDVALLEKGIFDQEKKEQQVLDHFNEGQRRREAWLHAQENGLASLRSNLKKINEFLLQVYLEQKDLFLEKQEIEKDSLAIHEDLARIEQQRKELLSQPFSSDSTSRLLSQEQAEAIAKKAVSLSEQLRLKKSEWQAVRKTPNSPAIETLKAAIENLEKANRGLREELSYLSASFKRASQQKQSIEQTLKRD